MLISQLNLNLKHIFILLFEFFKGLMIVFMIFLINEWELINIEPLPSRVINQINWNSLKNFIFASQITTIDKKENIDEILSEILLIFF